MDFCYVWLKIGLETEFDVFKSHTTRSRQEVAGNVTDGRGIDHFAEALSSVFVRYGKALKVDAPFVFTYHHNDPQAYAPVVVALLDAGLQCMAVLPAPGEMGASLHINNTGSSILDSVFVARYRPAKFQPLPTPEELEQLFVTNCQDMISGGVRLTLGDALCLMSGHIARLCVQDLIAEWDANQSIARRLTTVQHNLYVLAERYNAHDVPRTFLRERVRVPQEQPAQLEMELTLAPAV